MINRLKYAIELAQILSFNLNIPFDLMLKVSEQNGRQLTVSSICFARINENIILLQTGTAVSFLSHKPKTNDRVPKLQM